MDKRIALALAGLIVAYALDGRADEFDYEIGINYNASRLSQTVTPSFGPGLPIPSIMVDTDIDIDNIEFSGRWFFDGVMINEGPRERAAFLARAGFLTLAYGRLDGDSTLRTTSEDPLFPDSLERGQQSGNSFAVDGRYVWTTSGWYVLGGIATADLEFRDSNTRIDGDVTNYALGIGKYFGNRTSVDLVVQRAEADSGDEATDVALTLTRVGNLGNTWQYAADVALSTDDIGGSDGSYDIRATLYPSRDIGFGAGIRRALGDSRFDSTAFELFASWFVTENAGIEANYGWVDNDDPPDTKSDSDNFGIQGVFRF